tara:strand:+ start:780 stop:1019 length:240 start_codon:yes stop_codon:yes gene_type:complete
MSNINALIERAENLVEFARHSNDNELDIVVKEIVNFVQEQRLELLSEVLQLIKQRGQSEAIVKERQGEETSKLSKGRTL